MDRRRTAGALLALAACIACASAAPRYSESTALDLHDEGGPKPEGCYYNFQHYGEGDRIMTNEPCLNCTCHNQMLMCYLRVCPFTKPIGKECTLETRADLCCPIITCSDVPVDLLTSTESTAAAEYGMTGVGYLDKYGCSINGKFFPEGAKVPPTPNKPCEHCYCIRNMTTCVMQECTLHVDGCTPIYHKDVCCPVRYSCDHTEDMPLQLDDMSTTEGTTPGIQWTTTVAPSVMQECGHGNETFPDGASIKTEKPCEHCYCMKGDIVCVVQACGTPMEIEGKNCTSIAPPEGQCCPVTYMCEDDNEFTTTELFTEPPTKPTDYARAENKNQTTPIDITEGSGYAEITDDHTTEVITHVTEIDNGIKETTPSVIDLHKTTLQHSVDEEEPHTTITLSGHDDLSTAVTEKHNIETTTYSEETFIHDLEKSPTNAPEPPESHNTGSTEHPHITETYTTISEEDHTTEGSIEHDYVTSMSVDGKEPHTFESDETSNKDDDVRHSTTAPDNDTSESTDKPRYPMFNEEKEDLDKETTIAPVTDTSQITTVVPQEKITIESTSTYEPNKPIDIENEEETTSNTISEQYDVHETTPSIKDYNQETSLPDKEESHEMSTLSATEKEVTLDLTTPKKDMDYMTTSSPTDFKDLSTDIGHVYDKEYSTTSAIEGYDHSSEESNKINTIPIETIDDNTGSTIPAIISDLTGVYEDSDKTSTQASYIPDVDIKINIENNTELMDHHTTEGITDVIQPKPDSSPVVDDSAATTIEPSVDDTNETNTTLKPKEDEYTSDIQTFKPSSSTEEPDKGLNTVPDEEDSFTTQPTFIQHSTDDYHVEDVSETLTTVSPVDAITNKEYEITTETDAYSHTEKEAMVTVDNSDNKVDVTTETVTMPDQDETKTPDQIFTTLTPDKISTEKTEDLIGNEIPEENVSPIMSPGIIPGEGSCLVDGVTFTNNTIVPSSNKCQTACKCMSSIVKCDVINCSAPPDNMINCQPIYDTPESCCPSYICEDSKETIPPQPESHMTENTTKEPQRKCAGSECKLEEDIIPVKSSDLCTSDKCASQNTQVPNIPTDIHSACGTEGCTPDIPSTETILQEEPAVTSLPISKDKICPGGMNCTERAPSEECIGESCITKTDETSSTEKHISSDEISEYTTQNIIKETTILEEKATEKVITAEGEEGYKIPVDNTEGIETPITSEPVIDEEIPHLQTTESLPTESKLETDDQVYKETDTTSHPLDKTTEAHETTERQGTIQEKYDTTTPFYVKLEEHTYDDVTEPPYHSTESDNIIDISTIKSSNDEIIESKLSTTLPVSDTTEQIDDDLNTIIPVHEKPIKPTDSVDEEITNKATDVPELFTESHIVETTTSKLYNEELTTISEKDKSSTHEPMRTSDKPSTEEEIYEVDHETTTLAENAVTQKTIEDDMQEKTTTPILDFGHDGLSTHEPLIESSEATTPKEYVDRDTMTEVPYLDLTTLEPISSSMDERATTPKDYVDHKIITEAPHDDLSAHEPITSSVEETTPKDYDHKTMTEEPYDLSTNEPITTNVVDKLSTPMEYVDHEMLTEVPLVDISTHKSITISEDQVATTPKEYLDHEEPQDDLSTHEPTTNSADEKATTPKDYVDHKTMTEEPHADSSTREPIYSGTDEETVTPKDNVEYATMTEEPHVDLPTHKPVTDSFDKEATTLKDYVDQETMTEEPHVDIASVEPITRGVDEKSTTPKDYIDHETMTEEPHVDLPTQEPISSSADETTTTSKENLDYETITKEPHVDLTSQEVTIPKDYVDHKIVTEESHVDLSTQEPVTSGVNEESSTPKDDMEHGTMTDEAHVDFTTHEPILSNEDVKTTPKDYVDHETITEEPHIDLSTHEPVTISIDEKATTLKDFIDQETMTEQPHSDLSTQEPITSNAEEKTTTPKDYIDHETITEEPHIDLSTHESITSNVNEKATTSKDYLDHETITEEPHGDSSTHKPLTSSEGDDTTTPKNYDDNETMTTESLIELPVTSDTIEETSTLKDNVEHDTMTDKSHIDLTTHAPVTSSINKEETTSKVDVDHEIKTEEPHIDLPTQEPISSGADEEVITPNGNLEHDAMTEEHQVDLSTHEPITSSDDEKVTTPKNYFDHETMTEEPHGDLESQEHITISEDKEATTPKEYLDHEEPHVDLTTHEPTISSVNEIATTLDYVDHKTMIEEPHVDLPTQEPVTSNVHAETSTPIDTVEYDTITDKPHVDSSHGPVTSSVDEKATTPKDYDDHEIITEEPHLDLTTPEPITSSVDESAITSEDVTTQKPYVEHETISPENLATDKPVTEKLDHHELTTAEITYETSSHIPILESDHKDVTSHEDITTPAVHEDLTTPTLIQEISSEPSLHETEINTETTTHKIIIDDDHTKVSIATEIPVSPEETSEIETHHTTGYDITSEPSKITQSSSEHTFESSEIPEPVSSEEGDQNIPEAFPTNGYGPETDYGDDDQSFGPGTCRYGGKVYVSAQQIPRDDPCDFCFCFRSDIICLQQSCPPPIHGCHEEPIQGFCCPRYECPVSMATSLNVTTTTTTTTTTLPPHFLPHAYNGAAQKKGCHIKGHSYQVGEVVKTSSGPCLHCTCGGDGQMKCDPKVCTPEPMLRQMIAAAVSSKRRR